MGDITQALRTAQSGLLVNQQTLNVVSDNVANLNTEGYSRKLVNTEPRVIAGVGAGVQISEITRLVDEGLLKSLRQEYGDLNALTVQENFYSRTQDLFGAPGDNNSLAHQVQDFQSSLESLTLSPDKSLEQSDLIRRAQDVILRLQSMSATIQDLRLQADNDIASKVSDMNKIVQNIDQLNDDIISNGSVGRDVSDLRDNRDKLIDQLSQIVDIRYFFRNDGDVVIFTAGGRTLVDTVPPEITHEPASSVAATTTKAEGDFSGIYVGNIEPRNDITSELLGGDLKGLVDLRDKILPNMQSQLDEFAAELRDTFNQIHNRGVSFPGAQTYTGTRNFIDPANQTITFSGTDDTTVALFDSNGNQTAQTTVRTLLGGASSTINNLASTLQTWLRANGASGATVTVNSAQNFDIALNSTAVNLGFRDETATANGSTAEDASIAFDANGDGVTDETVNGFSNFLGLNDFFVDGLADNIYESDVLVSSFTASASTLTFRDSNGTLTGSPLTVAAGTSLTDLAKQITDNVTNMTASVVPDGSGVRLRIAHDNGSSFTVTEANTDTFLTDIGMHLADVRVSSVLGVRSDIAITPAKIATGLMQWDPSLGSNGEYFTSVGESTVIEALAEAFSSGHAFDTAGGLAQATGSFSEYATKIIADNSRLADANKSDIDRQRSLTDSLKFKSDTVRGVNLDQEMSDLIVFEQAFSASARVIAVIQRMIDALERVI